MIGSKFDVAGVAVAKGVLAGSARKGVRTYHGYWLAEDGDWTRRRRGRSVRRLMTKILTNLTM